MNLRQAAKSIPFLVFVVRRMRNLKNALFSPYSDLDAAEVSIFDAIKDDVRVVFDVGARLNLEYIQLARNNEDHDFYLFEPNPKYFEKLRQRITLEFEDGNLLQRVHLYNFGLGSVSGVLQYFEDVQSFVGDNGFRKTDGDQSIALEIRTLDEVCNLNFIRAIDFLKIDVEGMDYQVLLGGEKIIKSACKYCQFEFGVGKGLNGETTPKNYYEYFDNDFDLYFVKNPRHPLCQSNLKMPDLVRLTPEFKVLVERDLYMGSGCNLFAIRKGANLPQGLQRMIGDYQR